MEEARDKALEELRESIATNSRWSDKDKNVAYENYTPTSGSFEAGIHTPGTSGHTGYVMGGAPTGSHPNPPYGGGGRAQAPVPNTHNLLSKVGKLDFSKFDGIELRTWLYKIEQFF